MPTRMHACRVGCGRWCALQRCAVHSRRGGGRVVGGGGAAQANAHTHQRADEQAQGTAVECEAALRQQQQLLVHVCGLGRRIAIHPSIHPSPGQGARRAHLLVVGGLQAGTHSGNGGSNAWGRWWQEDGLMHESTRPWLVLMSGAAFLARPLTCWWWEGCSQAQWPRKEGAKEGTRRGRR